MEKFNKFCEKYAIVLWLVSYPILISTIEFQLSSESTSKYNLISLMLEWMHWLLVLLISMIFSLAAASHFIGFIWGKFND